MDITGDKDVQILDDTKSSRRSGTSTMDEEAIRLSGPNRRPHFEITKNSKRGNVKANMETDNLDSVQESKLETQLNTVPRKRGRKPNSLMNAEEAYDHSWISQETKPGKSANPERLAIAALLIHLLKNILLERISCIECLKLLVKL